MTEVSSSNLRSHGTGRSTVGTVHIHLMTPAVEIDASHLTGTVVVEEVDIIAVFP